MKRLAVEMAAIMKRSKRNGLMYENPYESPRIPDPHSAVRSANDGKHCPACGVDIGIWPIATAMLPNRIFCPGCGARLSYGGSVIRQTAFMIFVAFVVGAAAFWFVHMLGLASQLVALAVTLGILLVLWVLVEMAVSVYLRSRRVLQREG